MRGFEQDHIVIGGLRSPGRATIVRPGSPRKWDKQGGHGVSGAGLVYLGDELAEFDVLIDLWEPHHEAEWLAFASVVLDKRPTSRTDPGGAWEIEHPILNRPPARIHAVVVKNVEGPEQGDTGLWGYRIMLSAYRQPMVAIGKPPTATPNANIPAKAKSAEDLEIERLMAKQRELGGAL